MAESQLVLFEGTPREKTRLEKTPAALGPRETSRLAAVSFDSHSQAGIALAIFRGAGDSEVTRERNDGKVPATTAGES